MKRRIRRKLHSNFLTDIVYEISVAPKWRADLFKIPLREKLNIDRFSINGLSTYLTKEIRKKNLRYHVSVVPHLETKGRDDWDPTLLYFKFEAQEFPSVASFSANPPLTSK